MSRDRRLEPVRIDLHQPASLLTVDGRTVTIVFQDLSRSGFKFEHCDDLLVDDLVTIISRRGVSARGQIKWVAGQLAGGIFLGSAGAID